MSLPNKYAISAFVLFLSFIAPPAGAVEFTLDGYDRTRFYIFDTLSLDRESEDAEDNRCYLNQRLRLEPHLQINPHVHVFSQIDLLDLVVFGSDSEVSFYTGYTDALEGVDAEPSQLTDSVIPGEDYRGSAVVRRAWGEIWTPYVDLRFGRMGNHWGMGLLANDGNDIYSDFGDTVDRVQLLARFGPVQVSLAFDTFLEGWINDNDDIWGLTLAGGFLSDVHSAGAYVHWRRMPSEKWDALYADLWGRTHLGPLHFELEAVFQYGKGNATLQGVENMEVMAGGGAFRAGIEILPIGGQVEIGLASGDKDLTDEKVHTFSFDRDHDIALLLFQETMPQFRDLTETLETNDLVAPTTGNAVSNAFYFKAGPYIYPRDNLRLGLDFIAAQQLIHENEDLKAEDKHLAVELDFDARWILYENFELGARVGVMFPGPMYEPYRETVFGTEIRGIIRF